MKESLYVRMAIIARGVSVFTVFLVGTVYIFYPVLDEYIRRSQVQGVKELAIVLRSEMQIYIERNLAYHPWTFLDDQFGANQKLTMDGSGSDDDLAKILRIKFDNTNYDLVVRTRITSQGKVRMCVRIKEKIPPYGALLYSSAPSGNVGWEGNFYMQSFLNTGSPFISGGWCLNNGYVANDYQG